MEQISENLVVWFKERNLVNERNQEEYVYALLVTLEGLITTITMLLIGVELGRGIEAIIFLVAFFILRGRTGGYHAKSFRVCFIATIMTFIAILNMIECLADNYIVMYVTCFVAVCIIGKIGTVNHPNIDMNINELKESRKRARQILVQESIVIVILELLKVKRLYISCIVVAIILCSILLILAKICKQEVNINEE